MTGKKVNSKQEQKRNHTFFWKKTPQGALNKQDSVTKVFWLIVSHPHNLRQSIVQPFIARALYLWMIISLNRDNVCHPDLSYFYFSLHAHNQISKCADTNKSLFILCPQLSLNLVMSESLLSSLM